MNIRVQFGYAEVSPVTGTEPRENVTEHVTLRHGAIDVRDDDLLVWAPHVNISFQKGAGSFDLEDDLVLAKGQVLRQLLQLRIQRDLYLAILGLLRLICQGLLLASWRYILLGHVILLDAFGVGALGRRGDLCLQRKLNIGIR